MTIESYLFKIFVVIFYSLYVYSMTVDFHCFKDKWAQLSLSLTFFFPTLVSGNSETFY